MNARRLTLATLTTVCALAGTLLLASAPALALNTHLFSASFAGAGSGAGQLALASNSGVAVNSSTHDVYVADTGNRRVDQFSSAGVFIRAWGWGVADGLPGFETCTLSCQAGVSGSGAGQFTTPVFVAVDNSAGTSAGDVYVADTTSNLVQKFTASGALVAGWGSVGRLDGSTATDGPFGLIAGVAVDTGGVLMVINGNNQVFEFAQDGSFATDFASVRGTTRNGLAVDAAGDFFKVNGDMSVEELTSGAAIDVGQVTSNSSASGIAVDGTTGGLYASEGDHVEHFAFTGLGVVSEPGGTTTCTVAPSSGCGASDSFGSGVLGAGAGLGVDSASGSVYVADATASQVRVFTSAVLPDVSGGAPSGLAATSVTLNGSVNPAGVQLTDCHFDYGTTGSYGQSTPCVPGAASISADSNAHAVTANLSGLAPDTTYHFRLVAGNAAGVTDGADQLVSMQGPPLIDSQSAGSVTTTTATLQAQINPFGLDTTYRFQYGTTTSYGTIVPAPDGDIGSGQGDQAASQDLTGLQVGVIYHYRVIATNSQGTVTGADQTFTTLPAVAIDAITVSNVTTTTVTLSAQINPGGVDTAYHIEYGATTAYGTSIPVPDASIGAGQGDQPVSQNITGLQPNSTYHFRVVASNALGTSQSTDQLFMTRGDPASCPNAALRTGPSANLPDCRAYELVTPADKGTSSQDLIFNGGGGLSAQALPSSDGNRIAVFASSVMFGPNPMASGSFSVFSRTGSGWGITSVNPPGSAGDLYGGGGVSGGLFSPDLTQTAVDIKSTPAPSPNDRYSVGAPGGPFTAFSTVPTGYNSFFGGGTPDLRTVLLDSTDHTLLAGGAPTGTVAGAHDVYQWAAGRLSLVNVTSAGSLISPCGANSVSTTSQSSGAIPGSVSDDGSKVFFVSPDDVFYNTPGHGAGVSDPSCQSPPQLYMRLNGSQTVKVSAPDPGVVDPNGPQPVTFEGASRDGSKVFFATTGELTPDDAGYHDMELYEYDTDTRTLTRISHGNTHTAAGDLVGIYGVESTVMVSADGSVVYFLAHRQLAPVVSGGISTGTRNTAGLLYRYDTITGVTRYVAAPNQVNFSTPPARANVYQATPDGRFLLFLSGGGDAANDDQLYRYDSADSSLTCVSCAPGNAPNAGDAGLLETRVALATANSSPRFVSISDDGSYVFFVTTDRLVPQDQNVLGGGVFGGSAPGEDVYEWHNGTVQLISSGSDSQPSVFIGASADGRDAFFSTHVQLASQDIDGLADVYDARIGGGFPVPAGSAPCEGDACQSPSSAPNDATPSSAAFSGPGDPVPGVTPKALVVKAKKCVKGKVLKKGKCVKKKRTKKKKKKKARGAARRAVKHNRGGSK
jgi:Fibronectin type III domain